VRAPCLDPRRLTGALFAHADVWLTPDLGRGYNPGAVWVSSPFVCRNLSSASNSTWWQGQTRSYMTAGGAARIVDSILGELRASFAASGVQETDGICSGFSDIFHLPRLAWQPMRETLKVAWKAGLTSSSHVEVTVPLIIYALRLRFATMAMQLLHCWGDCCHLATDESALPFVRAFTCGHRLDLTSDVMRAEMCSIWANGSRSPIVSRNGRPASASRDAAVFIQPSERTRDGGRVQGWARWIAGRGKLAVVRKAQRSAR